MVASSSPAALSCAHALGDVASLLLADTALSLSQGGALAAAFSAAPPSGACAWDGLALTYALPSACAPPPPPPVPLIATSAPTATAASLDDLMRALADPAVGTILINAHIALNGTALIAALGAAGGTRTLVIEGTNACARLSGVTPLCSLSAGGQSRVFIVSEGLSLSLSNLLLRDGMAPPGGFGGCVLADCAACALELNDVRVTGCAAPNAGGGGVAFMGGGALRAVNLEADGNSAAVGAGLFAAGVTSLQLNGSSFHDNVARGAARDMAATMAAAWPDDHARGAGGGGVALFGVAGAVTGCTFQRNAASTKDIVLVSNPNVEQARGGGLLAFGCSVAISGSSFVANTASYGGGVYVEDSAASLSACALTRNLATLGDGGALFAKDTIGILAVGNSLVSGNAAGGHTGGGLAVMNGSLAVALSVLAANAALNGCGGAIGLDVGSSLLLQGGSVVHGNTARRGGGLCCIQCADMRAADSFLFDNAASDAGGAIHSSWTPTTVLNVSLWANSAPAGGAIAAVSAPLNVTDCVLRDNAATGTHGGAIFHNAEDDARESSLALTRCVLANNACNAAGGAVAAFGSASAVITACEFTNNSATSSAPAGGGVFALNVAELSLRNCTLDSNRVAFAPALASGAALGFVAGVSALGVGLGGGLWVGSDGATRAEVLGTLFVRNSGASGGAVYVTGAAALTIQASDFQHGHATDWRGRGGGIVTDASAALSVLDSLFFSCEANTGGAGWHGGQSTATYARCMFDANEGIDGEDMKGMALRVDDDAQLFVDGSAFRGHFGPPLVEGTIALGGSNVSHLTVTNSLFDNNVAHLGGCLFIVRCNSAALCGTLLFLLSRSFRPCLIPPAFADGVLAGAPAERQRRHVPQQLCVRGRRAVQ
jgi:hypothetical protein